MEAGNINFTFISSKKLKELNLQPWFNKIFARTCRSYFLQ